MLTEKELEALPDDPDELQQDLEALAGPSAGPNGGQMYIDGFTAGQLPPKSSIREIRINQNPFSAEFDKVGYGRIEIFTKPGTNQWHGQISVNRNDAAFNAKNPFATTNAGYASTQIEGNIGGPLSKKASFFFNTDDRDIHDQSLVSAFTLPFNCGTQSLGFTESLCSQSLSSPRTRFNGGPRLDYQLTKNNTLSGRFQYFRNNATDSGIGGLTLPTNAYDVLTTEQTLQLTDTQVIGSRMINETHFQYRREGGTENPYSTLPELDVLGAFTGGGNSLGTTDDHENLYELQNYTSYAFGKHFVKFGARVRAMHDSNTATGSQSAGFNGVFTFSSLNNYATTEQDLANGLSLAAIRALGFGPTQFSLITGNPYASVSHGGRISIRGGRLADAAEHNGQLWPAPGDARSHQRSCRFGAPARRGLGTRRGKGRAEDRAASRMGNFLRPLPSEPGPPGGPPERRHRTGTHHFQS